jgi:RimJ/RimL family protein N-acetyltransferase
MGELWPFFDLVVQTPRLQLRYPSDDELELLAEVAASGIHDPGDMPFSLPWSRLEPPALERNILQFAWRCRAELAPRSWQMPLVVVEEEVVVGCQDLFATEFPTARVVETGSWLARSAQGRGIGKEMRAAVLHLAFEHLGAREAHSASFADNPASAAVSAANGYEPNGTVVVDREGAPVRQDRWRLTRERWEVQRRDDILVSGIDGCLALLGVEGA